MFPDPLPVLRGTPVAYECAAGYLDHTMTTSIGLTTCGADGTFNGTFCRGEIEISSTHANYLL